MTARSIQRDLFVVFVGGEPGAEADYAEWFCGSHREDMMRMPEVDSAHMFTIESLDGLPEPARLCAIYETRDGIALLDAIGKAKGTEKLPEHPHQGPMSWRLFNGTHASGAALPGQTPLLLFLLPGEPDRENVPDLSSVADDWAIAHLSPAQSRRGREYGSAVLVALAPLDRADEMIERTCGRFDPEGARRLLLQPCQG